MLNKPTGEYLSYSELLERDLLSEYDCSTENYEEVCISKMSAEMDDILSSIKSIKGLSENNELLDKLLVKL